MVSNSKFERSLNFIFNDHVLRLPIITLTTLASLYIHFVGSPDIEHNNISLRIACVLFSQVVLILGLRVSYRLCRLIPNRPLGAIVFIASLPIIGAMRGLVLEHYLGDFHLVSQGDFYFRVFGSAITMGACVAGLSYAVGVYETWSRKSADLEVSQLKLETLLSDATVRVEADRNEDLSFIKSELFRGLRVNSSRNESELIAALQAVVVEVLKPMSERIISSSPVPAVIEPSKESAKFQFRSLLRFLTLNKSARPVLITLSLIATFTPVVLRFEGLLSTLEIICLAIALVFPSLLLLQVVISKSVDKILSGWRIPVLLLLLGLSVAPFDLVLPLVMPNIKEVNLLPVQALVTVISLGFVFGLGSAADLEIQRIQTAQIVNANRIRWNTARFYATHWFQKRQYARKLHGPMQAEILAHVIRLEHSLTAGGSANHPAPTSRDDLEAKLLELLNAPRVDLRPDEVLADLAETWEGICTIDVSFDEGLPQALIQDQIACETVLEIIREATSNAIQHGGATEIRVCVASGIEDCVSLTVTDNGSGVGDDSGEKGQGSRYLEECTVEYALESGSFGAALTAKIPLSCPRGQELQVA